MYFQSQHGLPFVLASIFGCFLFLAIHGAEERRSWKEEDGVEVEIIKKIPGKFGGNPNGEIGQLINRVKVQNQK
jgi:hypothetical protein